jgi:RHS repeat-associated protein
VYYYVLNLQGDVMAILDSNGANVVSYQYSAWGTRSSVTGSKKDTLGVYNPLRYRGYVYDEELGLYYLQSRYYNPTWGRFINADALVSTGQGILGNNMVSDYLNHIRRGRGPMSLSEQPCHFDRAEGEWRNPFLSVIKENGFFDSALLRSE